MHSTTRNHKPPPPPCFFSTQLVSPSSTHPKAQSIHRNDPGSLKQSRLLWHPPLFVLHSSTSAYTTLASERPRTRMKLLGYKLRHTFASRVPIVRPPRRTVTACSATRFFNACALAVASAIVFRAKILYSNHANGHVRVSQPHTTDTSSAYSAVPKQPMSGHHPQLADMLRTLALTRTWDSHA